MMIMMMMNMMMIMITTIIKFLLLFLVKTVLVQCTYLVTFTKITHIFSLAKYMTYTVHEIEEHQPCNIASHLSVWKKINMRYSSRICNQNLYLTNCKSKCLKYIKYQSESFKKCKIIKKKLVSL